MDLPGLNNSPPDSLPATGQVRGYELGGPSLPWHRDAFALIAGKITHAEFLHRARRRDRVQRHLVARRQRPRAVRRAAAQAARKAGTDDGDGSEPPGEPPDPTVVVEILSPALARLQVFTRGFLISMTGRVPRDERDLEIAVELARRAIAGDPKVRWSS